jgi:uncharacterized protein YndB with AHSA1/START domain
MIDIVRQLEAIHRHVDKRQLESGEGVGVLLRREYDATAEDVWDALTDPERVRRWFLPLHGDLKVGGSFQLEGNAGGDILKCEPPTLLRVTFGGPTSIVELRLTPGDGEVTVLELEHTVPIEIAGSGAGSLFVGPGWDGLLMGLGLYLRGEVPDDPVAAANSPETQEFNVGSIRAWAAVTEASGTATADEIASGTAMAYAQFAPDHAPENG